VALAPALFDRVKKNVELGYDEAGLTEGLELKSQVGTGDAIADIQAAVNAVKDAGKVAIVGYCWGGYLAYLSGNKVGGLACAIGYYGGGITDAFQEKRKVPTLLHFSEEDPLISFEEVANSGLTGRMSAFSPIQRGTASTALNAAVITRKRPQKPLSAPCSGSANMWKVSPQSC